MAKKTQPAVPFRQLGGGIPAALADDLDRLVRKLGLVKKRAVAAAVCSFVHAEPKEQMRLYQDVFDRYYEEPGPKGLTEDTQAALGRAKRGEQAKRTKPRRKRRPA